VKRDVARGGTADSTFFRDLLISESIDKVVPVTWAEAIPIDNVALQTSSSPYIDFRLTETTKAEIEMAGIDDLRTDIRDLRKELQDNLRAQRTEMRDEFKAFSDQLTSSLDRLVTELKTQGEKNTTQIAELEKEVIRIGTTIGTWGKIIAIAVPSAIAIAGLIIAAWPN
jgi:hypothetical protein